jgi:outer membrane biosynthesis protein TonB
MELKIFIFSLFLSFGLAAQTSHKDTSVTYKFDFSKSRIMYPSVARDNGIQGKVYILFDIDSTCALVNRRIDKGIGYGCDEEALKQLDSAEIILKRQHKSKCYSAKNFKTSITFKIH